MTENQQSTAALDEAAAEAVESQEETEIEEEAQEQVAEVQETDEPEEELPQEHRQRSDLGRKVSAMHRRMDETDQTLNRIASLLEEKALNDREANDDTDPDDPLTVADFKRLSAEQDRSKQVQQEKYDSNYRKAVTTLGGDLDDTEWHDVVEEMKAMPLDSTGDPQKDAERNFYKAERVFLRKKLANPVTKENPLKKKDIPSGVVTQQKTVVTEQSAPKLDAHAKSYYDFVAKRDGDKAAKKLLKGSD